ncbi:MAG: SulP family inorganic anion transporter [Methylocystis sp.]
MNNDETTQWRLFRSFRGLGAGALRFDLIAGLTLAAVAIPEQMATARLGGFPPHIGFFAFIAGSIAFAAFGSNRFLSAGADSTITPIFAGALAAVATVGGADYAELAVILAGLVGVCLLLAGVFRAGWVADLLSIPVMTGFLAGVAIHIAISQTPALLGLPPGEGEVFHRLAMIVDDIGETNLLTLAVGASVLASIVLFEKISPRIPGALIALATATFVVARFNLEEKGVALVGAFTVAPPHPSVHVPSLDHLSHVLGLAVIISVIIMVQTAATSRSFPGAPGETPDVDRDFIGLGAGSLLAGLFGAFPVNASPPRTAIVAETGGRSQIAGLVACAAVVATALYGAKLLALVPEAALAGVLLFVAGRIFRVPEMLDIRGKTKAEFGLVVVTMLAVVILPVQTGVALAIMLSLVHGVWTTTRTRLIEFDRLPGGTVWWPVKADFTGEKLLGVLVVAFQAPLSFLNAYQFQSDMKDAIARVDGGLRLVVLEASSIVEIDFTAARILRDVIAQCRAQGVDFAIVRLESVRAQAALENFGVMATLRADRLFHSVDEATRKLAPDAALGVAG